MTENRVHRTRGSRRARRALPAAITALAALALAACTGLPTSGAVQASDVKVSAAPDIDVLAEGPEPGASADAIVGRFLLAQGSGFADNFGVAREYLAGDARSAWKPLAGVVVAGDVHVGAAAHGEVAVDVSVLGRVDASGNYAEAAPDAHETVTFGMVQDSNDEWRISTAPDGLVLLNDVFQRQFRQAAVYFLSADKTYLVPDTRWFPAKNLQTSVMDALLAGPSPWLQDAVTTAVPAGLQLKPESVTTAEGAAQVSLGPSPAIAKDDRPLLLAQIDASLAVLPGVFSVHVDANGVPLDGAQTLKGGPIAAGISKPLTFLSGGRLVELDGVTVSPVRDVGSLEGLGASDPATGADGTRVMLSHGRSLVTVPTASEAAQVLYASGPLVAPSVDRFGWAWTSNGTDVVAARAGAAPVTIRADWLAGRTVRSLRVAADGARVAIVSHGADGVRVDVAGVTRDDHGVPRQLGVPTRAGTTLTDATQVTWVDEATLGVLGQSDGSTSPYVNLVPVAGPTTVLPQIADVVDLAGGPSLVVATKDGTLRRFVTPTWVQVDGVTGASDPSYPG
ncbi:LpqB family beta-propeller domain-containing protein [Cellulomonas alba]|uniref:LpqB family beta-propeller domain-containing protein n=1 Tax=Cellulomonas alba TaxID=3053467 RepID=A0ABT7SCS7_9CELL|nr:LpqB family beta-propeller domain-containing protein [Cellulomonas alba]MDM7853988.1 LpqB family beta-propeller domain-containing protein [Cellulomonas alba]